MTDHLTVSSVGKTYGISYFLFTLITLSRLAIVCLLKEEKKYHHWKIYHGVRCKIIEGLDVEWRSYPIGGIK